MSEPVYTVMVEDRHADIEVKVFGNYKKAKAWVDDLLEMYLARGNDEPDKARKRGTKDGGCEWWTFGESNAITLQRQDLL